MSDLALADVYELVAGEALHGAVGHISPSDCQRFLARVPEMGSVASAASLGLRARHFKLIARRDPDRFGLCLGRALEEYIARRAGKSATADSREGRT